MSMPPPPQQQQSAVKRKPSTKNLHAPAAKKIKHNTPKAAPPAAAVVTPREPAQQVTPVVQGMLKTRKNSLTLEEGNKLKHQIANLSGAQQMAVLEILRENKEPLDQDEEGNVEMEFRDFSQKSIDDLKAYVTSVTMGNGTNASRQQQQPQAHGKDDSESDSDSSSSDSDSDDSD